MGTHRCFAGQDSCGMSPITHCFCKVVMSNGDTPLLCGSGFLRNVPVTQVLLRKLLRFFTSLRYVQNDKKVCYE